jgi:His/Glu/Gln/Arg/opine family amino acid ABC transporter permease subunit
MGAFFSSIQNGFNAWLEQLHFTFIESNRYMTLVDGFIKTLQITFGALVIGVVIGMLIAVVKYFAEDVKALKPLALLCDFYVTAVRGIPVVVLLLIFYFIVMASADGITVAIITFGINSGAYMAELIRSGINAVDKGQMEAGRSLGMSRSQTMRKVIFPQAIRYILPAIGNELIALLKETSVAGYVAVVDVTKAATNIRNKTFDAVNPIILLALTYLAMVVILTRLLAILERRLGKSDGK